MSPASRSGRIGCGSGRPADRPRCRATASPGTSSRRSPASAPAISNFRLTADSIPCTRGHRLPQGPAAAAQEQEAVDHLGSPAGPTHPGGARVCRKPSGCAAVGVPAPIRAGAQYSGETERCAVTLATLKRILACHSNASHHIVLGHTVGVGRERSAAMCSPARRWRSTPASLLDRPRDAGVSC